MKLDGHFLVKVWQETRHVLHTYVSHVEGENQRLFTEIVDSISCAIFEIEKVRPNNNNEARRV